MIQVNYNPSTHIFDLVDTENLKTASVKESEFVGNSTFKYDSNFDNRFLKELPSHQNVQYSEEAQARIREIRDFNREDT